MRSGIFTEAATVGRVQPRSIQAQATRCTTETLICSLVDQLRRRKVEPESELTSPLEREREKPYSARPTNHIEEKLRRKAPARLA